MIREKLIEALKLAAEIEPNGSVCAEHDVIYVIGTDDLTDEQVAKFKAIGCRLDRQVGSIAVFV